MAVAVLSYSQHLSSMSAKSMALPWPQEPTTRKCSCARYPEPLMPGTMGTLFMIRTLPCTPLGTNDHDSTGIAVAFISPLLTLISSITAGSYVIS